MTTSLDESLKSLKQPNIKFTPNQINKEIWRRGLLENLLWPQQKVLFDFYHNNGKEITVFNCPRQFGKSVFLLMLAVSLCRQTPGFKVKFGAPTAKQANDIVHETMPVVLETCPEEYRPGFAASKMRYTFPHENGLDSELYIAGLDVGDGHRLRGTNAHLVIIDEAGFVNKLSHIVESIVLPMFKRTQGRLIISSTPAEDASHDFFTCIDQAHAQDAYIKRTLFDDVIDGEESIQRTIDLYTLKDKTGKVLVEAKDNPRFQREYMCERISNPDAVIFPEFTMFQDAIVFKETTTTYRPRHYQPIVSFDFGFVDFDGGLYGYVDFEKATLVIEDETWINGVIISTLGTIVKGKVNELWPHIKNIDDIVFYADNDPRNIATLREETNLKFRPVDNQFDKDPVVSSLRGLMSNGRLKVHDRCTQLRYQLENGMWQLTRSGNKKNDFIRNKKVGHCDLISALLYMYRQADFKNNPMPLTGSAAGADLFGTDKYRSKGNWDVLKGRRYGRTNNTRYS